MRVELDFSKSIEQNASDYAQKAKKARQKRDRIAKAILDMQQQLQSAQNRAEAVSVATTVFAKRKKDWFEKFRWSHTPTGLVIIGGRDAKSNDTVIKRHFEEGDLFFHATAHGAPHCVLKTEGKKPSSEDLAHAAQFAAVYSKAWESGLATAEVYSVPFGQVSKSAPSGQSIGSGAFMVYGTRTWFRNLALEWGIGLESTPQGFRVCAAPARLLEKTARVYQSIRPGGTEKGKLAAQLAVSWSRELAQKLPPVIVEELLSLLPPSKSHLQKGRL